MTCEIIKKCRVCDSEALVPILSLGDHPLANAFKKALGQEEERYRLTLSFCSNCSLVQLRETVSKDLLFKKYIWVTGTSETARRFAYEFYNNIQQVREFVQGDLIVEVGSNDGTFLMPFIESNFNTIGVDPAKNIADIANESGIKTINAFWNEDIANKIVSQYGNAKLIFARNVIPHVSELHEVISGIFQCLADDGLGVLEFHYVGNILEQLQYDSIYHEHLCYFSIKTIKYLLNLHDLHPFHIELSHISGGAYIIYFTKGRNPLFGDFGRLVSREDRLCVNELHWWRSFATRCNNHRQKSRQMVDAFSEETIVGFGASARSSTYLNFCGFSDSHIAAIIDNNKLKQKLYTPGSTIPIVSFDEGLDMKPRLIFVLAWNFKDEIMRACRDKGYAGDFLIPFPNEPYLVIKQSEGTK